eukprot:scaffold12582_cov126-Isochrysis_galbana.AAC.3
MTFDGVVVAHGGGPPGGHSGDPKATDMNGLARSVKTKTLAASAHFFFPRFSASLQGESDRPRLRGMECEMDHSHLFPINMATSRCYLYVIRYNTAVGWRRRLESWLMRMA